MSIEISEHGTYIHVKGSRRGSGIIALDHTEQRELLETLARIHGFTLVDHVERRSLMALIDEALDEDYDGDISLPAVDWRVLAKTLASTVADALRFDNPKEV